MVRIPALALAAVLVAVSLPAAAQGANRCAHHGPGFVDVPGTSTCVKVSGSTAAVAEFGRGGARTGTGASAAADARATTGAGEVRAYVRMRAGQGFVPR